MLFITWMHFGLARHHIHSMYSRKLANKYSTFELSELNEIYQNSAILSSDHQVFTAWQFSNHQLHMQYAFCLYYEKETLLTYVLISCLIESVGRLTRSRDYLIILKSFYFLIAVPSILFCLTCAKCLSGSRTFSASSYVSWNILLGSTILFYLLCYTSAIRLVVGGFYC